MNDELMHYGILGMKWGVRRYRNPDGTLTEEGKKRYASVTPTTRLPNILGGSANNPNTGLRKGPPDINGGGADTSNARIQKDLENVKNVLINAKDINRVFKEKQKKSREKMLSRLDLSNMTEAEMRSKINRELLERQYNQLFNGQEISKGKEKVSGFLDKFGDLLAVSASGVSIAIGISQLLR